MGSTQSQKSNSFKNKQVNSRVILVASTGVAIWYVIRLIPKWRLSEAIWAK